MDIIGIDHNSISFFVAFAFLPDESEGSHQWALANLKGLFDILHPIQQPRPSVISTDCDQALRNAISSIFPETPILLCLWYANKNIQQHCKGKVYAEIRSKRERGVKPSLNSIKKKKKGC
jgi:hypothetical protein